MKTCTGCSQGKPISEYYRHPNTPDGHASKCKECAKSIVKTARAKKSEHYSAYEKTRAQRADRVAARIAYSKTEAGKSAAKRARNVYKSRSPERRAAHNAVGNAVRDKRLLPWPVCAIPECNHKPEAHHPDYSAPLDVVWLCPAHHRQTHAMTRGAP